MKKYLTILLPITALGYFIFVPTQKSAVTERSYQNEIPSSIGTKDDPRARALQEFMMLRN